MITFNFKKGKSTDSLILNILLNSPPETLTGFTLKSEYCTKVADVASPKSTLNLY